MMELGRFSSNAAAVLSEENPGTGKIAALNVLAALDSLTTPLRVGT